MIKALPSLCTSLHLHGILKNTVQNSRNFASFWWHRAYKLRVQVGIPTGHCCEQFLFRKVFILKIDILNRHCSQRSLFRKIVIPQGTYSKKAVF